MIVFLRKKTSYFRKKRASDRVIPVGGPAESEIEDENGRERCRSRSRTRTSVGRDRGRGQGPDDPVARGGIPDQEFAIRTKASYPCAMIRALPWIILIAGVLGLTRTLSRRPHAQQERQDMWGTFGGARHRLYVIVGVPGTGCMPLISNTYVPPDESRRGQPARSSTDRGQSAEAISTRVQLASW